MRRFSTGREPRSLTFDDGRLVDWLDGGASYDLATGSRHSGLLPADHGFDTASTAGPVVALVQRFGTAGLLLARDTGRVLRPITRDAYQADAFAFPICLWPGPDGRTLLAHCPEAHNRIEIDDAVTGERLTTGDRRHLADVFHSRLAASPGGGRLLSAGWCWHPWDVVLHFDVQAALADPTVLDDLRGATPQSRHVCLAEEGSACWLGDDLLLLGGTDEPEDPDEAAEHPEQRLRPRGLAVYDLVAEQVTSSVELDHAPGDLVPMGQGRVLTLDEHPRLYEIETGTLLGEWPDLCTDRPPSSIQRGRLPPPFAADPDGRRFAVAAGDTITVVAL